MSRDKGPPVSTMRAMLLCAGIRGPLGSGKPQRAIVFSGTASCNLSLPGMFPATGSTAP